MNFFIKIDSLLTEIDSNHAITAKISHLVNESQVLNLSTSNINNIDYKNKNNFGAISKYFSKIFTSANQIKIMNTTNLSDAKDINNKIG